MREKDNKSNGESGLDETDSLYWIKRMKALNQEIFSHGFRVSVLAEFIGNELQLSEGELGDLRRGCFLHDIGKVMIPEDILAQEEPLNEEEQKTLNLHPVLGELIVSSIRGLAPSVAGTVRSHHERWDGTGFPDRLKGEDIPLYARICRIADAFDKMLQKRTVHKVEALIEAKNKLKQGCDTEYDTDLVYVFLSLPEEKLSAYSL